MISRRGTLGVLAGGALSGCGRVRRNDVLSWWAMAVEGENAPLLLPRFQQRTGITVDVQSLPWTGAHEKLLTAYAGNSLPDVMMLTDRWIAELAMLGALAPVPADRPGLLAGQFPGVVDAVKYGGRAVAVPWTVDAWVQYYRRDLLAEVGYPAPPEDWAEWTRMAQAIKRRHPDRFATLHLLDWPEPLWNFAAQQPEPLLRDHGTRGNYASPGYKAALAFYKSIYDRGFAPAITGSEVGNSISQFARGWFAILPSSFEAIGDLRRRAQDVPANNWRVAATPSPSGRSGVWAAGNTLAVSATCRDPQRAWRLVEYLCEPATQLQLHAVTGDLPARQATWASPALARSPVEAAFAREIRRAVPPQNIPEGERIRTEVQLVAEHMVRGEYGVDAAAVEMNRRVDAILAKRRWLLDRGMIA